MGIMGGCVRGAEGAYIPTDTFHTPTQSVRQTESRRTGRDGRTFLLSMSAEAEKSLALALAFFGCFFAPPPTPPPPPLLLLRFFLAYVPCPVSVMIVVRAQ